MKGWRQAAGWLLLVFSLVSFAFSLPAPRAGEEVAFDASGSMDPDRKIVRYLWDFDGNGEMDAEGIEATCAFPKTGTCIVTLTVGNALWEATMPLDRTSLKARAGSTHVSPSFSSSTWPSARSGGAHLFAVPAA